MKKSISILGTRGIPASHGGFETFAEYLSKYLVNKGWEVTVYCQKQGKGKIFNDNWLGIKRVNIPVMNKGALGTIIFDLKSTLHAANSNSLLLTLGYNTAIFSLWYRFKNKINIINMDGIEWKRPKWSLLERSWLYINERFGCYLGNHLIADHPEILNHLSTRVSRNKISMIPYGADSINSADVSKIRSLGLNPKEYLIVIARPEPENSILEIVTAFSREKRDKKLVVLGNYNTGDLEYCSKVKDSASDEVIFPGAIYDKSIVQALRFYSLVYIHGHQVGGTNPSLVESLGAMNPILAHDNKFNNWVAGGSSKYFSTIEECDSLLTELLRDSAKLELLSKSSQKQHLELFTWDVILSKYESLLSQYL